MTLPVSQRVGPPKHLQSLWNRRLQRLLAVYALAYFQLGFGLSAH